jgi:hypothetical protein
MGEWNKMLMHIEGKRNGRLTTSLKVYYRQLSELQTTRHSCEKNANTSQARYSRAVSVIVNALLNLIAVREVFYIAWSEQVKSRLVIATRRRELSEENLIRYFIAAILIRNLLYGIHDPLKSTTNNKT